MSEPNFSQREGITPLEKEFQINSMDSDLRNGLWNVITKHCLQIVYSEIKYFSEIQNLYRTIYEDFFKEPSDQFPLYIYDIRNEVRKRYFEFEWQDVYNFVEFLAKSGNIENGSPFVQDCNRILKREFSAYRFVSGKIVKLTSEEQIKEIESAVKSRVNAVSEHLNQGLESLSDKLNPDYRNSIKESISAVEAICQKISGNPKATLGDALNSIKKQGKITIPARLNTAFDKIYAYASSSQGIRHALSDEPEVTEEEARFMLVSCSAFINYLTIKSDKSGIVLR